MPGSTARPEVRDPATGEVSDRTGEDPARIVPAPPPARAADEPGPDRDDSTPIERRPAFRLDRIAWAVTTLVFAIAGLVLLTDSYYGYASVTFAVAAAAGINLV